LKLGRKGRRERGVGWGGGGPGAWGHAMLKGKKGRYVGRNEEGEDKEKTEDKY
jgi:hypothetical protein